MCTDDSVPSGIYMIHPRNEPRAIVLTVLLEFRDDSVILMRDTGLHIRD